MAEHEQSTHHFELSRRALFAALAAVVVPVAPGLLRACRHARTDPLPSWNDGQRSRRSSISSAATDQGVQPDFVPPDERIATFDQDGTLWVEHPDVQPGDLLPGAGSGAGRREPELKDVEPFKTVLTGNKEAIAKLPMKDLEKILAATLTGMSVEDFKAEVANGSRRRRIRAGSAHIPSLTYQPMQEVLGYLRANGYKTYIVTGGGQDFVRVYSEGTYGIPPEQVVGTAGSTKYSYGKDGKPFLTKEPKLLLNDNDAGKPEGIHLMIGRRPVPPSAIRPATSRCWNTPRRAKARGWHAGAARRRRARIRLWPGQGPARHQGRNLHPGAVRRGHEGWLDRHQHEEGLEKDLRLRRMKSASLEDQIGLGCSWRDRS